MNLLETVALRGVLDGQFAAGVGMHVEAEIEVVVLGHFLRF